jgi:hypothetical protein
LPKLPKFDPPNSDWKPETSQHQYQKSQITNQKSVTNFGNYGNSGDYGNSRPFG